MSIFYRWARNGAIVAQRALLSISLLATMSIVSTSRLAAAEGYHRGPLDNLRASIDVSARAVHSDGQFWTQTVLGLDIHNVLGNHNGDFGTLVFQPYLVRIDNAPSVPPLFKDRHDAALQWRIANFNYTGLGRGRFNIRLGHFELPFGLEHVVQTNGTLYQMNAQASTGLKTDWGASINGQLPRLEYELAFMRGAGNDFGSRADGFFVGRIGTPRTHTWWAGLSAMDGEVEANDSVLTRRRLGIDVGMTFNNGIQALLEHARGKDADKQVRTTLAEISTTTPSESTFLYLQWRHTDVRKSSSHDGSRRATLGVRYEPNRHWSSSIAINHTPDSVQDPTAIVGQLRYRLQK